MSTYFFILFPYFFCTLYHLAQFAYFSFGDCDGFWAFICPFYTLTNVKNCYFFCDKILKKSTKRRKKSFFDKKTRGFALIFVLALA